MARRAEERREASEGKEGGSLISGLLPLLCLCPFSFFTAGSAGRRRRNAEICLAGRKEGREREAKANKYANAQRRRSRYERSASAAVRTTQLRDREAQVLVAEQKTIDHAT